MKALADVGKAGLVAAVLAGSVTLLAHQLDGDDDAMFKARFVSAAPLVEGSQVKIDGVVVGTVGDFTVRDGLAEVSLDLDDVALPLHEDARLTIRPVSLLGERYVDLDRGSADAPVLDRGDVIPESQTATSVGLDEVLNTVDDPTGAGLQALVTTLGEGMQGNGANVAEVIKALSPSMRETRALAQVLDEHNELLGRLVDNFEPVAGALAARDGKAMDRLVGASDEVLAVVQRRQERLDATLEKLPSTLSVLRSTLANLRTAADNTAPTLAELRPLTDKLPEFSAELREFSEVLDPALASSEPVLKRADELLRSAAPVAADLRRSGPDLAKTLDGAEEVVDRLTKNRDDLFKWVRYWALTTNGRDGLSHYFRVSATVNPQMLTGLLPATPTRDKTKPTQSQQEQPKESRKDPLGLQDTLDGLLGGLLGPLTGKDKRNPTGLTQTQESGLLGLLLGGR